MTHDEIVRYWIDTAEENYASMKRIFSATDDQKESMSRLMLYHLHARYPDWLQKIRRAMSQQRAERGAADVEELREWLLRELSGPSSQQSKST